MIKKSLYIGLCIAIFTVIVLNIVSLFNDPDSIKIAKSIYYNVQRKDILDYNGKYEIPPEVIDYCTIDNKLIVKWKPDYPIPAIYDKYDYGYSEKYIIMYWVIDIENETQIGPMDFSEFDNYCKTGGLFPVFSR
jgi:hypothetical protein